MNDPAKTFLLEAARALPALQNFAVQLRSISSQDEDYACAVAVLEDLVQPALHAIEIATRAVESGSKATDIPFGKALNFLATLPRFAGERRFPTTIDVDGFLTCIDSVAALAARLYYRT
jgi:hypothetical protein